MARTPSHGETLRLSFALWCVLCFLAGAGVTYVGMRVYSTYFAPSQEEPQITSEMVPEAPGPDNTIKTLRLPEESPADETSKDETPAESPAGEEDHP